MHPCCRSSRCFCRTPGSQVGQTLSKHIVRAEHASLLSIEQMFLQDPRFTGGPDTEQAHCEGGACIPAVDRADVCCRTPCSQVGQPLTKHVVRADHASLLSLKQMLLPDPMFTGGPATEQARCEGGSCIPAVAQADVFAGTHRPLCTDLGTTIANLLDVQTPSWPDPQIPHPFEEDNASLWGSKI